MANPIGRPSDYKQEYCDIVIKLGTEGKSYTQIAVDLGITRKTLYAWGEAHPEFLNALERARECAQAWWERQGMLGMWADKFNAAVWNKSMSCRFPDDYTDKTKQEMSGKQELTVEIVRYGTGSAS